MATPQYRLSKDSVKGRLIHFTMPVTGSFRCAPSGEKRKDAGCTD